MIKDTVFQQILKPLTTKLIAESSKRFRSDYDYEMFKTADHLRVMIFTHLCEIKSLRTLEAAINSRKIGLSKKISRSTLSDANKKRPAQAFIWILEQLMLLLPRKKCKEINEVVRLLDSSPIQLRGKGYEWTKEYATHQIQGLKLHVEYDLALEAPMKIEISHPNCNDVVMGQRWLIKPDTIYVFDKGYYDFNWWWSIHQQGASFVTRLKKNVAICMVKENEVNGETVLEDGNFRLKNKNPRGGKVNLYQEPLRRISIKREGKKPLILVTNRHDLPADVIGSLYKSRWEIELFFKWIKQNLKIKKFLGKSANAVKIQLATALIAYLLVLLFKNVTKDKRHLYLVLVWARYNLDKKNHRYRAHAPPEYVFSTERVYL
jgi:hypothetical protein